MGVSVLSSIQLRCKYTYEPWPEARRRHTSILIHLLKWHGQHKASKVLWIFMNRIQCNRMAFMYYYFHDVLASDKLLGIGIFKNC